MEQKRSKFIERFRRVRSWYGRWERPLSSLSLISGFVFDALALKRVDEFWEIFWVIVHLLIVGFAILVANRIENNPGDEKDPAKFHFWLVNIMQFFFGGLLGTFLVFYFRSGSLAVSWPFLLVLAAAFWANESLKHHYARLTFQVALFFLSVYAFAIFFVPLLMHEIGPTVFIVSGLASLAFIALFLLVIKILSGERFHGQLGKLILLVTGIFLAVNILYFFNLIPPLPLSLSDAGIYQSFLINGPGNYVAQAEAPEPFAFLHIYQDVHIVPGTPLYAYSAVFSPTSFSTTVVHEWQFYNNGTGSWITRGRIPLTVTGGGANGYRTFSEEFDLTPGLWRVNVLTPSGAVIGRLDFNVIYASTTPALQTQIID
ncbi:MAG TPA: DUF2914 domain-containing protein [Candidatus Paceibacterota bacterium]|nr:DUF2914 domain-containing protein [Candidatus Paceibacterota bacterium]